MNIDELDGKTAQQMLGDMMGVELFLVNSTCLVDPSELTTLLADHLRYMIRLEREGVLFASGPLMGAEGEMTGNGITVLRVSSIEEATKIAHGDPFYKNGLRRFDIHKWIVNEGRLSFGIDLSSGRAILS